MAFSLPTLCGYIIKRFAVHNYCTSCLIYRLKASYINLKFWLEFRGCVFGFAVLTLLTELTELGLSYRQLME